MSLRMALVLCLALASTVPAFAADEPKTFAERLGWPADARVVIFHCDDAGMSHSSNVGAIESIENGVVTSVSTMMPCGWVPEFAHWLKENPEVDNGIHVTLTSEWKKYRWAPLAGVDQVPGLVDEEGAMWHSVQQVAQNASGEEVAKEIQAQLDRARSLGIPVTHLDTHMGTVYAKPEFFMAYAKVGIDNNIPIMLPGGHMTYVKEREGGTTADQLLAMGIPEMVWNAGLPVLDDLITGIDSEPDYKVKSAKLIEVLRALKPGVTQIIVHSTRPTEEFKEITGSGPNRLAELEMMTNPEVKKAIEDEGIILSTWRELKERRDKVGQAQAAE